MSKRFGNFLFAGVCILALVCGVLLVILPLLPPSAQQTGGETETPTDDMSAAGHANADSYGNEFRVDIIPWTPSTVLGERVQAGITNIGTATYNWVMFDVSFADENDVVKRTVQSGAHSQIRPNETVYSYVSAAGIENTRAYISHVQGDRFLDNPNGGVIANY